MCDKPFLSYQDQISRLLEKGISCTDNQEVETLISKGYFNLVNGYKRPFVKLKSDEGNHIYFEGTRLEDIIKVFYFDRKLSNLLLTNLTHVEEEIRSITAYQFDKVNAINATHWNDVASYDERIDSKRIDCLISDIEEEIQVAQSNQNEYIVHYSNSFNKIPTWVMIKVIKLTTFSTLLKYSKREVKEKICELYDMEHVSRDNDFGVLLGAIHWMRKVRNASAHNERLIFLIDNSRIVITKYHRMLTHAYRQRLRNKQVVDLVIFLKYFNSFSQYQKLIDCILSELTDMKKSINHNVFENIRASLGFRHLEHLMLLRDSPKDLDFKRLL